MSKTYIGVDNGTTGSIGILADGKTLYVHTPTKKELSYTKKKQYISRIDTAKLADLLDEFAMDNAIAILERPLVNPGRFKATVSGVRALEATLIVLEMLKVPYQYIDSKEWQKALLPSGLKGNELKKASLEVGKRLFPQVDFSGFKDADGLLIAEYARRKNW